MIHALPERPSSQHATCCFSPLLENDSSSSFTTCSLSSPQTPQNTSLPTPAGHTELKASHFQPGQHLLSLDKNPQTGRGYSSPQGPCSHFICHTAEAGHWLKATLRLFKQMFVTVINAYSGPISYTKAGHKIAKLHFLRWLCWAFPRAQLWNWRQRAQPWALSADSANRAPPDPRTVLFYATGDLQEWKHLSGLRDIKWRGNVKELVAE